MSHSIELDDKTLRRLEAAGRSRHKTPATIARLAIEAYLDREEAYNRELSEDSARWDRYVTNGETIPDEDVARWLEAASSERA